MVNIIKKYCFAKINDQMDKCMNITMHFKFVSMSNLVIVSIETVLSVL